MENLAAISIYLIASINLMVGLFMLARLVPSLPEIEKCLKK